MTSAFTPSAKQADTLSDKVHLCEPPARIEAIHPLRRSNPPNPFPRMFGMKPSEAAPTGHVVKIGIIGLVKEKIDAKEGTMC